MIDLLTHHTKNGDIIQNWIKSIVNTHAAADNVSIGAMVVLNPIPVPEAARNHDTNLLTLPVCFESWYDKIM